MCEKVEVKCPYCGCGSARVERSMDGYCRCDRCKEVFIDRTIPLKLLLSEANAKIADLEQKVELATEATKIVWTEKEKLKCCGNCLWRLQETSDCCLPESPYYTYVWVDADEKCDKWVAQP